MNVMSNHFEYQKISDNAYCVDKFSDIQEISFDIYYLLNAKLKATNDSFYKETIYYIKTYNKNNQNLIQFKNNLKNGLDIELLESDILLFKDIFTSLNNQLKLFKSKGYNGKDILSIQYNKLTEVSTTDISAEYVDEFNDVLKLLENSHKTLNDIYNEFPELLI